MKDINWAYTPHRSEEGFKSYLRTVAARISEPPEPEVIDLGLFELNRSETIAAKLAAITDSKAVGYRTNWATDEKFPDTRTGKVRVRASAVCFRRPIMSQKGKDNVEAWCLKNKKILALPKDGIDIAKVSARPKLDNVMPLVMAGQFFVDANGDRSALYFNLNGNLRGLDVVCRSPGEQWCDFWWFLVLEELPLAA